MDIFDFDEFNFIELQECINELEREQERENNYFKKLGNYVKYDSEECINCGRARVNIFDNGNKVCEKCGFDQKTGKSYCNEYGTWFEFDI